MSRIEILSKSIRPYCKETSAPVSHRVFFQFGKKRIFASQHLTFQPLKESLRKEDINVFDKFSLISKVIGESFALKTINADVKIVVEKKKVYYFDYFLGKDKSNKNCILIRFY